MGLIFRDTVTGNEDHKAVIFVKVDSMKIKLDVKTDRLRKPNAQESDNPGNSDSKIAASNTVISAMKSNPELKSNSRVCIQEISISFSMEVRKIITPGRKPEGKPGILLPGNSPTGRKSSKKAGKGTPHFISRGNTGKLKLQFEAYLSSSSGQFRQNKLGSRTLFTRTDDQTSVSTNHKVRSRLMSTGRPTNKKST